MPSKTITIKDEVYNLLISLKQEDESFSDLLERLAMGSISVLRSMAGSVEFGDKDALLDDIRSKRHFNDLTPQ